MWKNALTFLWMVALTGCAAPQPAPLPAATLPASPTATAAPTQTLPAAPSPTPMTISSPTPLPDLPDQPFTWAGKERPLLLAHYMPWYQAPPTHPGWGWHWTMDTFVPTQNEDGAWTNFASHYQPLTGLYDSSDPLLLEYQVQLMKLSGIDGVIVDWYGMEDIGDYASLNSATAQLFAAVKKAGLKFAICYEDQTLKHMVDKGHLQAAGAEAHAQKVMAYLQDTWFGDEPYLRDSGRPVLFIFGPQYFKDAETWERLFSGLPEKPLFVTLDNALLPAAESAYPWPPMGASKGGVLNQAALSRYLNEFYSKAGGWNWPYVVGGAFPGFNDIYKEAGVSAGYGFLDALDGQTFRYTLQLALDQAPQAIQLITWNDYGEGTNIEPTLEYGYRYLEIVQEARKVTDPGFAFTPADLRLPFQLYQLRALAAKNSTPAALLKLQQASQALLDGNIQSARQLLTTNP